MEMKKSDQEKAPKKVNDALYNANLILFKLTQSKDQANNISDLFTTNLIFLNHQYRELCEKKIFQDPLKYGTKYEEVIWFKIYYDVIKRVKAMSDKGMNKTDFALFTKHLNAGVGFYIHFISKLQQEFKLNLQNCNLTLLKMPSTRKEIAAEVTEWATDAVYRSLIHLGDLFRYQFKYGVQKHFSNASRYYLQAVALKPHMGFPYNQLGMLTLTDNKLLDAVYYFLRCYYAEVPYELVTGNLENLFNKNADSFLRNAFSHRFLLLIEILFFEKRFTPANLYSRLLLDLQAYLPRPNLPELKNKDAFTLYTNNVMTGENMFYVTVTLILIFNKLNENKLANLIKYKSFLMAVFSHLIQFVYDFTHNKIIEVENARKDKKARKKNLTGTRRKKVIENRDDSDLSESGRPDDASSSEDEETRLKSNLTKAVATIHEDFIKSVKPFCDLLSVNSCLFFETENGLEALRKLMNLLNLLNANIFKLVNKHELYVFDDNYEKIPITEDEVLRGIPFFDTFHKQINWDYLTNNNRLKPNEQIFIRIQKLIQFGQHLSTIEGLNVSYDKKESMFTFNEDAFIAEQELQKQKKAEQETMQPENNHGLRLTPSRQKLMKHMGQLWLDHEIEELKQSIRETIVFPPFLVVDSDALVYYPHLLKQLIAARTFIVIVPNAVIGALDDYKQHVAGRQAIRWLEKEFQDGNKHFRAQQPNEKMKLPDVRYPKARNFMTYRYIHVLECCYFLAQSQKDVSDLVIFLSGSDYYINRIESEFNFRQTAEDHGIQLQFIEDFFKYWKKTTKNMVNKKIVH